MSLDPVINFGKVTVSIGYNASDTSIVLTTGHGANLPATFSYNLVWWDSTTYPDPADDPNVEIVRVTNRVTDTLTVTRAQEGTSATVKNIAGKTYKMILAFTKKMKDDIETAIPKENLLINGGFSVTQRGTSFDSTTVPVNNDDTYLLDRNILLSDGNDIVDVTHQSSGGISGNENYIRLDVETVSKKFGILQIIENKNLKSIIGGTASLSFEARVSNAAKLSDIRAVVLAWDSTVDTVTSDIVSTWNVEGTRPTLVANWTAENVDSDLGVTTSWVRYTIENISIDTASAANIAVFIYQNNVATNDTLGVFLEITNVKLESGTFVTNFQYREFGSELVMCERYYVRYEESVQKALVSGFSTTTSRVFASIRFHAMRTNPSFSKSAVNAIQIIYRATSAVSTSISGSFIGLNGAQLTINVSGTPLTVGEGVGTRINANDWIAFDAEL